MDSAPIQKVEPNSVSRGWANLALSVARVNQVFWEDLRCNIEVLVGEDRRAKYEGVEILMPSIGARHFLGAIPEVGDLCICGWFAANSNAGANKKSPAILAWMPRTTFLGHEWLPTQDFSPEENIQNTPKSRRENQASINRVRHKLRHFEMGNIGASSAQGADLVLDEGVTLSNRRANEIRLRDQDQALIIRSLQQFHAMAGARVYGGMVQRDARSLPKEMFTDSVNWNQDTLVSGSGEILDNEENETGIGKLNPHPLFLRGEEGATAFEGEGGSIDDAVNPYDFLYRAGLIDEEGYYQGLDGEVYGGKSILRINERGASVEEEGDALVEYRVEVNHTSDGALPVTEQTDGFDADRLPDQVGVGKNIPLVEFVLGTPVGNDPFSEEGASKYGLPLTVDFKSDDDVLLTGIRADTPLGAHAATLLKVNPVGGDIDASFVSFTKGGGWKAKISSTEPDAVRARIDGGVNISSGGPFRISSPEIIFDSGTPSIDGSSALGFNSPQGAIEIFAGGFFAPDASNTEGRDTDIERVGLSLSATNAVRVSSPLAVSVESPKIGLRNASEIQVSAQSVLSLQGGEQVSIETKQKKELVTGKHELVLSGPTDFNPLNGFVRSITIGANPATGFVGGIVDNYLCAFGDRASTYLTTSNVLTTIAAGSHTTTVTAGAITSTNVVSTIAQTPVGISVVSTAVATITAGASVSISAGADLGLRSIGKASLSGASVILGAAGASVGPILCGSDLDPVVGLPYAALGLPPRGQVLGPPV
jgi:hypothetical protein